MIHSVEECPIITMNGTAASKPMPCMAIRLTGCFAAIRSEMRPAIRIPTKANRCV